MHRHSRRRRHRSSAREIDWFRRVALVLVLLIGIVTLVAYCALFPAGRVALLIVGATAALVTAGVLSCAAGRGAAAVCNVFARAAGRASLEKIAREQHTRRAA
jgi:hypothetical protein